MPLTLATTEPVGATGTDAGADYTVVTVGGIRVWNRRVGPSVRTVADDADRLVKFPTPAEGDTAIYPDDALWIHDGNQWEQAGGTNKSTTTNSNTATVADSPAGGDDYELGLRLAFNSDTTIKAVTIISPGQLALPGRALRIWRDGAVVYTQPLADTLARGLNTITLNTPFAVSAGQTIIISYPSAAGGPNHDFVVAWGNPQPIAPEVSSVDSIYSETPGQLPVLGDNQAVNYGMAAILDRDAGPVQTVQAFNVNVFADLAALATSNPGDTGTLADGAVYRKQADGSWTQVAARRPVLLRVADINGRDQLNGLGYGDLVLVGNRNLYRWNGAQWEFMANNAEPAFNTFADLAARDAATQNIGDYAKVGDVVYVNTVGGYQPIGSAGGGIKVQNATYQDLVQVNVDNAGGDIARDQYGNYWLYDTHEGFWKAISEAPFVRHDDKAALDNDTEQPQNTLAKTNDGRTWFFEDGNWELFSQPFNPALIPEVHVVADSAARTALTGLVSGDEAIQTSDNTQWVWTGTTWVQRAEPGIKFKWQPTQNNVTDINGLDPNNGHLTALSNNEADTVYLYSPNIGGWVPISNALITGYNEADTQNEVSNYPNGTFGLADNGSLFIANDGDGTKLIDGGTQNIKRSHKHEQATAATTWPIQHDMGYEPGGVTVTSATGEVLVPATITYPDVNNVVLTFSVAIAGTARLS